MCAARAAIARERRGGRLVQNVTKRLRWSDMVATLSRVIVPHARLVSESVEIGMGVKISCVASAHVHDGSIVLVVCRSVRQLLVCCPSRMKLPKLWCVGSVARLSSSLRWAGGSGGAVGWMATARKTCTDAGGSSGCGVSVGGNGSEETAVAAGGGRGGPMCAARAAIARERRGGRGCRRLVQNVTKRLRWG